MVIVFTAGYAARVFYEAVYWPKLYLNRNLSDNLGGARRHREHKLTRREHQVIFELLEKIEEFGASAKASDGFVQVQTVTDWVVKNVPFLADKKDTVHAVVQSTLGGEAEFSFPTFESSFGHTLTSITLMHYGHITADPANPDQMSDNSRNRRPIDALQLAGDASPSSGPTGELRMRIAKSSGPAEGGIDSDSDEEQAVGECKHSEEKHTAWEKQQHHPMHHQPLAKATSGPSKHKPSSGTEKSGGRERPDYAVQNDDHQEGNPGFNTWV